MSKHRPSVGYDDPSVEHPTDTQAVQELVRRASLAGRPVRVIGSMHSEDGSVLHWGKALPADYDASSTTNGWEPYPKLNDFLQERRKQDPHGLFLTEYWRRHLGITDPVIGPTPTTATNTRTSTTKSP